MKALDVNVVLVRLNKIEDYINRLEKYQNITLEEYLNSQDIQMITERIIQIITEAALDINKYILSCNGILETKKNWTNKEYFIMAAQQQILTEDLAIELAKAAGMRNVLVHLYLDIDSRQIFEGIHQSLIYYPLYIRQVLTYLDSTNLN
ncbi:Conserved protein [Crocosphaera watsonii WH 0005]|uniref:Conserved protein n=5 Tax=Crocosphaera watsonii TaxID=263511 RepID=T2J166_CROWT|nr:DUF86 domain-containing protein [Crocosphaera watsonii]CCQ58150.1 Conserved protein [Crocosphaera watsonii WH 0005]